MIEQHITFLIQCEVKAECLAEFDAIVPKMDDAANSDPGTVEYRWYRGATPTARCLYERYQDSDATIAHMEAFGQQWNERYMPLIELKSVLMIGPASDRLTAILAPFFDGSVPGVSAVWYQPSTDRQRSDVGATAAGQ